MQGAATTCSGLHFAVQAPTQFAISPSTDW
jgi:hypothetical protein